MDYLSMAKAIQEELVENRRYLHQHAELGYELPKTKEYVLKQLRSYGYEPVELGGGIVCTCGQGNKTIMLRADMDALPQEEATGLEFACHDGACHSCGHDGHMTMLLGAARLLKENEKELNGIVKFVFQPAEEILSGAKGMIEAGVLKNPKVDVAMGLHLNFGDTGIEFMKPGNIATCSGGMMAGADAFKITVTGGAAHGSTPEKGKNALSAAANIVMALQQMPTLEISCDEPAMISICKMISGTASNVIPDKAVLEGSIRTFETESRNFMKKRLQEISQSVAELWGCQCQTEYLLECGPNVNDENLFKEMTGYCSEIMDRVQTLIPLRGSEDFAAYSEKIPTFFTLLVAGGKEEGYTYAMHDPRATFDENVLQYGVAMLCHCANQWLKNNG